MNFIETTDDITLLELALKEDLGTPQRDITSETLLGDDTNTKTAIIISKHPTTAIVCGIKLLPVLLEHANTTIALRIHIDDGECVAPGETLVTLEGVASDILRIERIALNLLCYLSGIATLTREYVDAVAGSNMQIMDTRKTLPGFRHLAKYAVQVGGGANHRMGLYDAMMVKDTHVDLLGGMRNVLKHIPLDRDYPVIIEVRELDELAIILDEGGGRVDRVLLDNMSPQELTKAVKIINNQMPAEASGNINLNNVSAIAKTGVNIASIGKLTHSPKHIDLSLKMTP